MANNVPPTIHDVARAAGVSIGTVSGVIHGRKSVNAELRKRVIKAIEELNYAPNALAQSMRFGSTRSIGVSVPHLTPVIAGWLSAAQDILYDAGYVTILGVANGRAEREVEFVKALVRRKIDGLLVAQGSEFDKPLTEALRASNVPIVLVDRNLPEWVDSVAVDHRSATQRAVDYLIKLGHRRISLLAGGEELYPSRERIGGYKDALASHGMTVDPDLLRTENYLADYGFQQARILQSLTHPPTAIIAGGLLLPGLLRGLHTLGLRVPHDISVAASSDSDLAELSTPSISVEDWSAAEVGATAARILLERLRTSSSGPPKRVILSAKFIARESCGPPPTIGNKVVDSSPKRRMAVRSR
jgi:LacI family transcriptional regulator